MPIMIPNGLPAAKTLADENIFVMNETRAVTQDIRPLQILVLNLMPTKIATETQLSRLLGNTPLQVELELIHTDSHESKNTSREHLLKFYQTFEDVKDRWFDGNTTPERSKRSICAIKTPVFPSMCRRIITRTTTTRSRPWSHGAVTQTSCTRTGSTTSSTRPRRTTSRPSGLYKHQKSGKGSPLEQRGEPLRLSAASSRPVKA